MEALLAQSLELERQGNIAQAITLLFDIAKQNLKAPSLWLHMASIARRSGQYDLVEKFQSTASQLYPSYNHIVDSSLPKKTILFCVLDWFFQKDPAPYQKVYDNGFYPVIVPQNVQHAIPLPDLTPDNFKAYSYKGLSFYDGVMFGSANILEKGIEEINPHSNKDWSVIVDHMQRMAAYSDYLSQMINFYKPEKVVYPQGYVFYASVMRQVAIQKNIPVLALEYTMHVDKVLHDSISGISVNKNTVRNMYWKMKDFISLKDSQAFKEDYFKNVSTTKHAEHKVPASVLDIDVSDKNKKTVLYIGQVGTDSSVLFGIRGFIKQSDVITATIDNVIQRGHRIIIKLHPKEKDGINALGNCKLNQLTYRWLMNDSLYLKYLNHPDIIIDTDNKYNTYDLIDRADFCITINSQAGLEALLRGKELILCGHSFYGGMGWTSEVFDKDDLAYMIEKHCSKETPDNAAPNPEILKFFYSFMNYSCFTKTLDNYLKLMTEG